MTPRERLAELLPDVPSEQIDAMLADARRYPDRRPFVIGGILGFLVERRQRAQV